MNKNISLIRIVPDTKFKRFLYKKHSTNSLNYDDYLGLLKKYNVLYPNDLSSELSNQGIESVDIVVNDFFLILSFLKKYDLPYPPKIISFESLVIYFIKIVKPDYVFIYAGAMLTINKTLRQKIKSEYFVNFIGYWGDELPTKYSYSEFSDYRHIFCASRIYVDYFKRVDIQASLLGNCFSFNSHDIFKNNYKSKYNVIFCGETGYGLPDHINRYEFLIELMNINNNLIIFSNEIKRPFTIIQLIKINTLNILSFLINQRLNYYLILFFKKRGLFKGCVFNILNLIKSIHKGNYASKFFINPEYDHGDYFYKKKSLKKLFPGRVFNQPMKYVEYLKIIKKSKIILNIHRSETADVANIRCFEVTAMKKCLLSNKNIYINDFFNNDDLITYNDVIDCSDKINKLLSEKKYRNYIEKNGFNTTMNNHLVFNRAKSICKTLKKLKKKY